MASSKSASLADMGAPTVASTASQRRAGAKAKSNSASSSSSSLSSSKPLAHKRVVLSQYETAVLSPVDSLADSDDDDSDDGSFAPSARRSASRPPPPAYQASEYSGSPSNMSEEDILEARRQFHLACEQTRRKTIKASLEELKAHIPTCENQKLTKAAILSKAISFLQSSKRQRELMTEDLNRLRNDLFAVRSACTCGAASHVCVTPDVAPSPVSTPAPSATASAGRPSLSRGSAPSMPMPDGWETIFTPEGRPLYRDISTSLTQWSHPALNTTASSRRGAPAMSVPTPTTLASIKRATSSSTSSLLSSSSAPSLLLQVPQAHQPQPARTTPARDLKLALVTEAASSTPLAASSVSPLDSAAMAIGDVMFADMWPASGADIRLFHGTAVSPFDPAMGHADEPRFDIFADGLDLLHPTVKRDRDEGYHSRETSYNGTEADTFLDTEMVLA